MEHWCPWSEHPCPKVVDGKHRCPCGSILASNGTDASVEASLLKIALIPSVEVSLLVVALIPLCGSILARDSTDTFCGSILASGGTDTSLWKYPCSGWH